MTELSFVMTAQINQECFANTLSDSDCNTYEIIDFWFVVKHCPEYINEISQIINNYEDEDTYIHKIICLSLNIDEHY